MEKKKLYSVFTLFLISSVLLSPFAFAEEFEIADDPEDDLRLFNVAVFEDLELDPGDYDELSDMKEIIKEVWSRGVSTTEPDYIDITSIKIDVGDPDGNSSFIIEVIGDPTGENVMVLIGGECSGGCTFFITGLSGSVFVDGGEYEANYYYAIDCNGNNQSGEMGVSEGQFEVEFPTEFLGDDDEDPDDDCDFWVCLLTDDEDSETLFRADFCPNSVVGEDGLLSMFSSGLFSSANLLLFLIIGGIVVFTLIYARKKAL